jgi:hypothetical protein
MSGNRAGSCVEPCPSEPAPAEYLAQPQEADAIHWVEFHFVTQTGHTIQDDAGFTLIHPDGHEEHGVLSNGGLERAGVPEGWYQMKFSVIESCGWSQTSVYGERAVEMWVKTAGFHAGSSVAFVVYRQFHSRATPLAQSRAEIQGGRATAKFEYKQELREPPGGHFVFSVVIGSKIAHSDVLTILPYPIESLRGTQQKLKHLGYYSGPTDGVHGQPTETAVRAFQKDRAMPEDGILDPNTVAALGRE